MCGAIVSCTDLHCLLCCRIIKVRIINHSLSYCPRFYKFGSNTTSEIRGFVTFNCLELYLDKRKKKTWRTILRPVLKMVAEVHTWRFLLTDCLRIMGLQASLCSHSPKQPFLGTSVVIFSKVPCMLTLSQTSPGFHVSAVSLLKTQWEKEKLLVTSNFSFF